MQKAVVIIGISISIAVGILLWLEGNRNKSSFKKLINKRDELSDELLRLEFGSNYAEWPTQLDVIKKLAVVLSLNYRKLRPKDRLSCLANTHRFSGDRLLEFELIILKNNLGNIDTVGELTRKISKIELKIE